MPSNFPDSKSILEVRSAMGKTIRTTAEYFDRICTIKHPELREPIATVLESIIHPTEVRHASQDIYLYYRVVDRYTLVAVARHHQWRRISGHRL